MKDPKTTIAGLSGLFGVVLTGVGQMMPSSKWSSVLTTLGVLLTGGAASLGNIASKDGGGTN